MTDKTQSIVFVIKALSYYGEPGSKNRLKLSRALLKYKTILSQLKTSIATAPRLSYQMETSFLEKYPVEERGKIREAIHGRSLSSVPNNIRPALLQHLQHIGGTWENKEAVRTIRAMLTANSKVELQREKFKVVRDEVRALAKDSSLPKTVVTPQNVKLKPLDIAARMSKQVHSSYAEAFLKQANGIIEETNRFGSLVLGIENYADTIEGQKQLRQPLLDTMNEVLGLARTLNNVPIKEAESPNEPPKSTTPKQEESNAPGYDVTSEAQRQREEASKKPRPRGRGRGRIPQQPSIT